MLVHKEGIWTLTDYGMTEWHHEIERSITWQKNSFG